MRGMYLAHQYCTSPRSGPAAMPVVRPAINVIANAQYQPGSGAPSRRATFHPHRPRSSGDRAQDS